MEIFECCFGKEEKTATRKSEQTEIVIESGQIIDECNQPKFMKLLKNHIGK